MFRKSRFAIRFGILWLGWLFQLPRVSGTQEDDASLTGWPQLAMGSETLRIAANFYRVRSPNYSSTYHGQL